MKQEIDPISQAMQILQLVTQRQGQRADIDQGQQRLDIARQGMRMDRRQGRQQREMQQQQFNTGLSWDREQAAQKQAQLEAALAWEREQALQQQQQFGLKMSWDQKQAELQQKQFEIAQNRAMLEAAQRMAMDERKLGAEEAWRKVQGQDVQQRQKQFQAGAISEIIPTIQNQVMMLQQDNPTEAAYQQEVLKQALSRLYSLIELPMPERPQVDPKVQAINY